jgi:hypothetical protein
MINSLIEGGSKLSKDEIERMKQEAELNADADRKEKEKVDKLNQADSMIFQTEKQVKEFADKISEDNKNEIQWPDNYGCSNSETEIYLNNGFGANLRAFLFEQITSDNIDYIKENIQNLIKLYFPNVKVDKLDILQYPDTNEIQIQIYYSIVDTGITDQVQITFT